MVRIQDSQSWHRGSIPLSTTMSFHLLDGGSFLFMCFYLVLFFVLFFWSFPQFVLSLQYETDWNYHKAIVVFFLSWMFDRNADGIRFVDAEKRGGAAIGNL